MGNSIGNYSKNYCEENEIKRRQKDVITFEYDNLSIASSTTTVNNKREIRCYIKVSYDELISLYKIILICDGKFDPLYIDTNNNELTEKLINTIPIIDYMHTDYNNCNIIVDKKLKNTYLSIDGLIDEIKKKNDLTYLEITNSRSILKIYELKMEKNNIDYVYINNDDYDSTCRINMLILKNIKHYTTEMVNWKYEIYSAKNEYYILYFR